VTVIRKRLAWLRERRFPLGNLHLTSSHERIPGFLAGLERWRRLLHTGEQALRDCRTPEMPVLGENSETEISPGDPHLDGGYGRLRGAAGGLSYSKVQLRREVAGPLTFPHVPYKTDSNTGLSFSFPCLRLARIWSSACRENWRAAPPKLGCRSGRTMTDPTSVRANLMRPPIARHVCLARRHARRTGRARRRLGPDGSTTSPSSSPAASCASNSRGAGAIYVADPSGHAVERCRVGRRRAGIEADGSRAAKALKEARTCYTHLPDGRAWPRDALCRTLARDEAAAIAHTKGDLAARAGHAATATRAGAGRGV